MRGTSGTNYGGDVDRGWYLGEPSSQPRRLYEITWECNQAMVEEIKPGNRRSDIYKACAQIERRYRLPRRRAGWVGHGLRNTGGFSVHPDNHTILEPNMIISVEPMFATEDRRFALEDQYCVTITGSEPLHDTAPRELPVIPA